MKQKHIYSAYRIPRFSLKDLGISLITLGFRKPGTFQEKAKIYKLILEYDVLEIYEEPATGESQWVGTYKLEKNERAVIDQKNKYYNDRFVYHLDRY